ncbi:MAG: Secretion system C-terminal sorting domain [Bacteroidota bacterium]
MPNPTSDFVTLVYDNLLAFGTIKIQDINGKVLFEQTLTDQSSLEIDLAFVERGVYIVVLTTSHGSVAKRLLKN